MHFTLKVICSWKNNGNSFHLRYFFVAVIIKDLCMVNLHFKYLTFSFVLYLQTENSPYQYRGIFHALSTVLREEGPRALYRGWLPSVIGVVSNFLFIYIYPVTQLV